MTDDDVLFDAYLDAALAGEAETVDEYCRRHGASEDLRQRLWKLRSAMLSSAENAGGNATSSDVPPTLGEFRMLEPLGEGGMGRVFRAEQTTLGRIVALKLIRPECATSPSARARFRREAEALARVQHPNLVTIHDVGDADGYLYLAMEEVRGEGLDQLIARAEPISIPRVLDWFAQIGRALEAVHAAGIVHRDLKPSNIRITEDDRATLLDFGLAHLDDQAALTQTGVFAGTPFYASPEQVRADSGWSAPTTDVYSLGVALYEAIVSDVPFSAETKERLFHEILICDPARPSRVRRDVPRDLDIVILKAMAKEACDRYQSAAAFADDLDAVREFRPISARPESWPRRVRRLAKRHSGWTAAAVVAVLALVVLVVLAAVERRDRERVRQSEIARHLESANRATADYSEAHGKLAELRVAIDRLEAAMLSRWLAPEERRTLRIERAAADAELARATESFFTAVESLREAERRGADRDRVDALRARLYVARWREARDLGRVAQADSLRERARRYDRAGQFSAELDPRGGLRFVSSPPGARVFLYRYRPASVVAPDGESRLIPIPFGGIGTLRPDAHALEVVETKGPLRRGDVISRVAGEPIADGLWAGWAEQGIEVFDRILSVNSKPVLSYVDLVLRLRQEAATGAEVLVLALRRDGADVRLELPAAVSLERVFFEADDLIALNDIPIPVEVYRDGEPRQLECLPGTRTARTATPLDRSSSAAVGTSPCAVEELPGGSYLALLLAEGHEPQRVPLLVEHGRVAEVEVTLHETAPEGFVYVPAGAFHTGADKFGLWATLPTKQVQVAGYWIQRLEVTRGEYAEFLNDPVTQEAIRTAEAPALYPRTSSSSHRGGAWVRFRQPDGTYQLSREKAAFAVGGVAWSDAVAYAAWKTERAKASGLPFRYRLPTELEWEKAARGVDGRRFVCGDDFLPTWADGRFSKPGPLRQDLPGRRPVDLSVYGVYDLSGGLLEWCASEPDSADRVCRGGTIGGTLIESFQVTSRFVVPPQSVEGVNGFRLVAEIDDAAQK